jgi:hypothetical protein
MKEPVDYSEIEGTTSLIRDVYVVYDGGDDRSAGRPTYFFLDKEVAEAKARGNGWYGGNSHVEQRYVVTVLDKGKWRYFLLDPIGEIADINQQTAQQRQKIFEDVKSKLTSIEYNVLLDFWKQNKS